MKALYQVVSADMTRRFWWDGAPGEAPLRPGDKVLDRDGRLVIRDVPGVEEIAVPGVEEIAEVVAAGASFKQLALADPAPPDDLPARLDAVMRALMQAQSDIDRLRIRDQAEALKRAAAVLRRTDVQVEASILVQTAEREIARANPPTDAAEAGRNGGRAAGRSRPGDRGVSREDTPINGGLVRRLRAAHAPLEDAAWERLLESARRRGEPLTRRLVAAASRPPKVVHNSGAAEWYTPPDIIEAARMVMSVIELDPCSSEVAQSIVRATHWYDRTHDGLSEDADWTASAVWLNPPYHATELWLNRLYTEIEAGRVGMALVLTNNSTETRWMQRIFRQAEIVLFFQGRIRFLGADGQPQQSPIQGQALSLLTSPQLPPSPRRALRERFATAFRGRGAILSGWVEDE